jgi:tRNA pseudouridine38-40 synthase
MPHWRATLTYDGTPYHGWQVQPNRTTVQGTLAGALLHLTGETVLPQGSGRTDAGVHALAQVASFSLAANIPAANLHRALNRTLPPSIRILSLTEALPGFHARHSALRKTYEYRILPRATPFETICPPFLAPYVWVATRFLDLDLLNEAAAHVVGTHDFTSFAAVDPDRSTRQSQHQTETIVPHEDNTRTIHASLWTHDPTPGGLLRYRVTGSGFLHHMVRNLVGTFVEAGADRLAPGQIPNILAARDRRAAGPTAPPHGLFLAMVEYPPT